MDGKLDLLSQTACGRPCEIAMPIQVVQTLVDLDHGVGKRHDFFPPTRFLQNILIEVSYCHDFFTDTKNKVKRTPQIP